MSAPETPAAASIRPATLPDRVRVRERELIRVTGQLGSTKAATAAHIARNETLKWAAQQIGDQLPEIASEGRPFDHLRGGRVCIGTGFADDSREFWALRVDRPDSHVAQRTWTTEVVIGHAVNGSSALFSLRLLVSTPEINLQVDPAVPALIRKVIEVCGLNQGGSPTSVGSWNIASEKDAENLVTELLDPARVIPYLVCSISEREKNPRVDSNLLAKGTLGIARVVVLPASFTWLLTQQFGKRLSVFNGAARAYMPGFTHDAHPDAHRLFLLDQSTDDDRAKSALTAMRWIAANESVRRLRLGSDVLAFSAVREASLDVERERLKLSGSADAEQLRAAQAQIDALKDDLRRSNETQQWLSDEHKYIEEHALNLEHQIRSANFRIQQLLEQIKARGDAPDASVCLPDNWAAIADWSEEVLSGRVTLSARARRETKSAEFDDPALVARCLLWLANEYRDSRINGANGDLRRPIEESIHNDRCGTDSFVFDWSNRKVTVDWHIKNGGNTRSPKRCLRIYYFWDEDTQQVVIASMPAHVRSGAT